MAMSFDSPFSHTVPSTVCEAPWLKDGVKNDVLEPTVSRHGGSPDNPFQTRERADYACLQKVGFTGWE
jgi:hypothetical protein